MKLYGWQRKLDLIKFPLLLFFCIVIFFYPLFFQDKVLFFGDNFSINVPLLSFFFGQLKKGNFSFWNPYLFSGMPLIGDQNLGLFYPFNVVFSFLPGFKALNLAIIANFSLASLGMFFFLRKMGLEEKFCFLGSLVFIFSDSMIKSVNNLPLLSASCWLPLIFLSLKKTLSQKKISAIFIAAVLLTLQFSAGHVAIQFYTWLLLVFYIIFYPRLTWKRKVKIGILLLFLYLGLTSFLALPFYQNIKLSTRKPAVLNELKQKSWSWSMLVQLILPYFFSQPQKGISWGPTWYWILPQTGYAGVIPLALVILSLFFVRPKKYHQKFFIYSGLIALLLCLGRSMPLFSLAYFLIPGFKYLRSPSLILVIYNFSLAVVFGFSLESLTIFLPFFKKKLLKPSKSILLLVKIVLLLVCALILGFKFWSSGVDQLVQSFYQLLTSRVNLGAFHNFERDKTIFVNAVQNLSFVIFLLCLGVILLVFLLRKKISLHLFFIALSLLVFFDLFYISRAYLFFAPNRLLNQPSKVAAFLQKDNSQFRFLSSSGLRSYTGLTSYWENMVFKPPFARSIYDSQEEKYLKVLATRKSLLVPNWGLSDKLGTINGYTSILNQNYVDFLKSSKQNGDPTNIAVLDFADERLNFLNVKYLIADKSFSQIPQELEANPQFELVYEDKDAKIYENGLVWPRAFLTDEQGRITAVDIKEYGANRIKLEIENDQPASLVLSDVYFPGWQVKVGEQEGRIGIYNQAFRSVRVPKGKYEVIFRYIPKPFYLGLLISTLSFFAGGLLCLRKNRSL